MLKNVNIPTKIIRCAEFSLFVPKGVQPKAVVVLVPGSNSDGRYMVQEAEWQKWARESKVALIGCHFKDKDPCAVEGYCNAAEESGGALLWAIRTFDEELQKDKNKENRVWVDRLPILLWGFSAGGQFAYEMNASFPERVKGFVVNKGGFYYTHLCSGRARQNYGLFFTGVKDGQWRQDSVKGLVSVNQAAGCANWELIEEDTGHAIGESEIISRNWFNSILDLL